MKQIKECLLAWVLSFLTNQRQGIAQRSFLVFFSKQKNQSCLYLASRKVPPNLEVNKLAIKKKNLRRVVAGLDESASASTETQNYTEPYVEEPLADEEWLQNYRKQQEDKEGLARELKSTLVSVPVRESHPPSTIFSFCCPYNTESHTL